MASEHLKQHQFQPGTSGNPGGRPKNLERLAREAVKLREYKAFDGKTYTGEEAAFHCLLDMFFNDRIQPRERIAAFKEWCDRGYGKAKQTVNVTGDGAPVATMPRDPANMTDEEIRKGLEALATLKSLAVMSADTEH